MDRQQNLRQQRDKLQGLVNRAKREPSFKQQVQDDPLGVLEQAGLSREAIGDFLREEGYADLDPNSPQLSPRKRNAVEAARWCEGCCLTCIFTECAFTRL